LCGKTGNMPCYELSIKAGFPFSYLYDKPGVSIEHELSIFEDDFKLTNFLLDYLIYFP
jgi:hypothetical protein